MVNTCFERTRFAVKIKKTVLFRSLKCIKTFCICSLFQLDEVKLIKSKSFVKRQKEKIQDVE